MDIAAAKFDWDEGNRAKCEQHGVAIRQIESVFRGSLAVFPTPTRRSAEERFKAIGIGENGRHVFVVFTFRAQSGEFLIRPISARYMHAKEVRHYERQTAETQKVAEAEKR
jgi:uncharacterized protein